MHIGVSSLSVSAREDSSPVSGGEKVVKFSDVFGAKVSSEDRWSRLIRVGDGFNVEDWHMV